MPKKTALFRFPRPTSAKEKAIYSAMVAIGILEIAKNLETESDKKTFFYYDFASYLLCSVVGYSALLSETADHDARFDSLLCLWGATLKVTELSKILHRLSTPGLQSMIVLFIGLLGMEGLFKQKHSSTVKQHQAPYNCMMLIGILEITKRLNTASNNEGIYCDLASSLICTAIGTLPLVDCLSGSTTHHLSMDNILCLIGSLAKGTELVLGRTPVISTVQVITMVAIGLLGLQGRFLPQYGLQVAENENEYRSLRNC